MDAKRAAVLSAHHVLEYPYSRTVGPVIGAFLTALRDRHIVGVRMADGRVLVPPTEYDPVTGETLSELVDVGDAGTVTTWTWVSDPKPEKHPLAEPFAFALIKLDGADTALLHAVAVSDEAAVRSGMRVHAKWRAETDGHIRDIECFVPRGRD